MLHWAVDDAAQTVKFAVSAARTSGYLAVGFSAHGSMIGSTAVIGWIKNDGSASVEMYRLDGYSTSSVTAITPTPLTGTAMSASDGSLTMEFTRPLASASGRRRLARTLDPAASEGFLWAYGSAARLGMHEKKGAFSIKLSGEGGGGILVPPIAKDHLTHGILMLIGWGVLLPIGVTFPAALRPVVGDPTWYRLHRAFQVVGLAVALSGFIVALTSFDLNELSTHGLVGTLAMTSGLLQALNGFMRPHKKAGQSRRHWELGHKLNGWLGLLLAAIAIILGVAKFEKLSGEYYPGVSTTLGAIFGVVAGVCSILVLRAMLRRFCEKPLSDPEIASTASGLEAVHGPAHAVAHKKFSTHATGGDL